MGDFNIEYNNDNNSRADEMFKNTTVIQGFKQIVSNCTRITHDSSTLIDHIFVTKSSCFPSTNVVATCIVIMILFTAVKK